MKIITRKNKLVLAELNPEAQYILLVNPYNVNLETLNSLRTDARMNIQIVIAYNIDEAIKFVEIPKKI